MIFHVVKQIPVKYRIYFILPLYIFYRNDIQPWYILKNLNESSTACSLRSLSIIYAQHSRLMGFHARALLRTGALNFTLDTPPFVRDVLKLLQSPSLIAVYYKMCFRLLVAALLVAFPAVLSQGLYPTERPGIGSCPVLSSNSEVFGNRTSFSNLGLLPTMFIRSDGTSPLILRIRRVHLLCEAIGLYRNTASSASYLVEYEVPGVSTPRLAQVSVDCIADSFNPSENYSFFPAPQPGSSQMIDLNTARNSLGTLVTDSAQIVSNFTTESAFTCGRCGPQGGIFADQATRCVCK